MIFNNLNPLCAVSHREWHDIAHLVSFDEFMEMPNAVEVAALLRKEPIILVGDQQIPLKELVKITRGHIRDYFDRVTEPASGD
ncbi:hypothetical protein [Shimazuella alba]|uniref:Uncharacterized protein n=1 Tax=Shimazuella alba TaxID=2690964 RepID=A0A6I4W3I8_9BACL|nr:hypothetical protein [Shimazuella alba]MXQ55344.1 hypothetical protein [Shimazuella alba]